jgi:uncharacterized GH25 family protein
MLRAVPLRPLAVIALALAALPASAHDTWLHRAQRQPGSGLLVLELGSGGRYPHSEFAIAGSRVADASCVDEAGKRSALVPRTEHEAWLELRARMGSARAAACSLELLAVEATLTPDLADLYMDDVRAPQAVRDAWAAQKKAGIAWKEVYRKYVRIEAAVDASQPAATFAELRKPRGQPLELIPAGNEPLAAGKPADFVALANGKPLANLSVEFVPSRGTIGLWRQSDAQGRLQVTLPSAGEWVLRATAFDIPSSPQEPWRTRFGTLTVEAR